MSQYYKRADGGSPSVPTSFTTDDSTTAIPDSNNLNVLSRDTTDENDNGIQTTADPNNSDNLYVELTNRVFGSDSVTGATTVDLITFDLGNTDAVFRFNLDITGRDTSSGDGVGYTVLGSIKTDGATATVIDTAFIDADEDNSLETANMSFIASGNDMILRATGVAGQTISYKVYGFFIKV